MLPLIFKRKKTAEFLRQNSGDMEERKKHGDPHHPHHPHHPHRPRTLEDSVYSGGGSQSCSFEGAQGSNPGGGGNPPRHGGGVGVDGGVGGGSGEGYYLSTGSGCSYYDCSRAVPQARRSPSPVGSGEWALRECEVHTTWLNELRKRLGQPTITDLRTAVADGITLVQLTEALTHIEVSAADQEPPLSRPQALVNLDRCLAHLAACGVDVIGIQASDLVEGDLKSLLLLLGQIRRRYEPAQGHRVQGDGDQRSAGTATERVTVHPARPFSDMPGRIDTSPQLPRASQRTDRAVSQMKRGPVVDEDRMIPGMMTSEEHAVMSSGHGLQQSADRHNHSTYKSSQHAPAASAKPSPAPRPQSSIGVTSERPPSQLGVAWAADSASKPRQTPESAVTTGPSAVSVEERLRQLMLDTHRTARSVQYDDGELLLPPPPSRDFGDGVTLGGVTVGPSPTDGPRPSLHSADFSQASRDQGYVPSRPSDRRQGPRVETMLERDSTNQQPDPYARHSGPPSGGQFTNYAYVPDSQPSSSHSEAQRSSVHKASDLRSAWNKLYGPVSDWRPPSRHDVTSSSLAGGRDSTGHEEFSLQPRGQAPRPFKPEPQRRHSQPQPAPYFALQRPGNPAPYPLQPRESPMGQSSSTQGQTSDSSYMSSQSGLTAAATFRPEGGRGKGGVGAEEGGEEEEEEEDREVRTLGPAGRYPDSTEGRPPSGARLTPQTVKQTFGLRDTFPGRSCALSRNNMKTSPRASPRDHRNSPAVNTSNSRDFNNPNRDFNNPNRDFNSGVKATGGAVRGEAEARRVGGARANLSFCPDSEEDGPDRNASGARLHAHGSDRIDGTDSIFDYGNRRPLFSESSSNRSVTPPLPPLSPSSSQPGSAPSTPTGGHSRRHNRPHGSQELPAQPPMLRQRSSSAMSVPRTPDLLVTSATPGLEERRVGEGEGTREGGSRQCDRGGGGGRGGGGAKNLVVPAEKSHGRMSSRGEKESQGYGSRYFARSRSLDDVRESGNESNDLSFDVETTMLTVAPSDISEVGEGGHHAPSHPSMPPKDARAIRGQLDRLESMYHDVMKMVGAEKTHGKSGRRWSIASSDTSSLRRGRHTRGGSSSSRPSKDLRSIQRRFQRLESHVVTLARSLAHLSSELRAHNTLRRELDGVKRELRELKQMQGPAAAAESPGGLFPPFEKFRGWIPSLTNPKRINKLTQFFGQEPPLLEIFLKKLGYERYAKNFAAEHIGMIELPYMTEERLEGIGIPMGPRLRILQESQLCFRQENFDIYIV